MERAYPEVCDRHVEQRFDAAPHLGRCLVGERDCQQALWRQSLDIDQPGGAMYEHARLAAAGTGDDERRLGRRRNSFALRVVEIFEDGRDVHEVLQCRSRGSAAS